MSRVKIFIVWCITVIILCVSYSVAQAQGIIFWYWDLYSSDYYVSPGGNVTFNAYLANFIESDGNITEGVMDDGWAQYNDGGTPGDFTYGIADDFFSQFSGIDLAPGDTFDFVFGQVAIDSNATLGTYGPTLAMGNDAREVFPESWQNYPLIHIVSQTQIPEPATLSLLGMGLLGLLRLKLKKRGG